LKTVEKKIGAIATRIVGEGKTLFGIPATTPEILNKRIWTSLKVAANRCNEQQRIWGKPDTITPEMLATILFKHDCRSYYSGQLLVNFSPSSHADGSNYTKLSFDRLDNSIKDYRRLSNLVPCLWFENRGKGVLTTDLFYRYSQEVTFYQLKLKNPGYELYFLSQEAKDILHDALESNTLKGKNPVQKL